MSSIVAINAGAIKIKEMSSYGTSNSLNVDSNLNVTGNLTIGNELLVLSELQSQNSNSGGLIVKGGLGVKRM